jgi:hypothetical protein
MSVALLPGFFERTLRRTFGDLGIEDASAVGYLADLLARFARTDALYGAATLAPRRLEGVLDTWLEIQRVWDLSGPGFDPSREVHLRRHMGDFTLFMTGLFREHVERMAARDYYEREGRRAYRFVAETGRARGAADAALFRRLADRFEHYAGALTYMRKVHLRAERLPGDLAREPLFRRLLDG